MRTKISLMLSLLCLPLAFWACGDDGSSSPVRDTSSSVPSDTSRVIPSEVEGSVDYVWETADDKVNCKESRSGKTAYYEHDGAVLICEYDEDSDEWIWTEYENDDDGNAESENGSGDKKTALDYLNPDIDYGEFTDKRDGQVYKMVKIGNQTWMAENLNYDYNVGTAKSTCYENEQDSCSKYGRLYSWSAAMDSAAMFSENGEGCGFYSYTCRPRGSIRGVCPDGWHLPSQTEWDTLFAAVGESTSSTMFKSLTGWESYSGVPAGSDVYGFSALPAGYWNYYNGNFEHVGQYAVFWSSNIYDSNEAYGVGLIYSDEDAIQSELYVSYAVSVRCLKNTDDANSTSSVNSSNSGWSWDVPKEERLNPEIEYGEMIDARDGQVYKTVEICDEDKSLCQTWMAENLNYADSVNTASLKGKSWCFDNKDANCDVTGRFYTWAAAIDSAALANDTENPQICGYGQSCDRLTSTALAEAPIQGICPSGWHLPSKTEWQVLFTAVGGSGNAGKTLKSGSGWYSNGNGTDAYGFSALPAGSGDYDGDFYGAGRNAYFWSATRYEYSCYYAFYMDLDYNYEYAYLGYGRKFNALSIRCLKDD